MLEFGLDSARLLPLPEAPLLPALFFALLSLAHQKIRQRDLPHPLLLLLAEHPLSEGLGTGRRRRLPAACGRGASHGRVLENKRGSLHLDLRHLVVAYISRRALRVQRVVVIIVPDDRFLLFMLLHVLPHPGNHPSLGLVVLVVLTAFAALLAVLVLLLCC